MADELSDRLIFVPGRKNTWKSYDLLRDRFWKIKPGTMVSSCLSSTATYQFPDTETKRIFEAILKEEGIEYAYEVPKVERVVPKSKPYSGGEFHNEWSMTGFIGDYNSVDEVIEADQKGLNEIGGSFEAIASQMEKLIKFGKNKKDVPNKFFDEVIGKLAKEFEEKYGEDYYDDPKLSKMYSAEWSKLMATLPQNRFDDQVSVLSYGTTRGFQECPFGCKLTWNEDVRVYNSETGKELMINKGTVHLAREHHLLEKGNEYGITAKEFYKHFMPNK